MEISSVAIWGALILLFLILEGGTVALVSLWFAAGALAALTGALLGAPFWLQVGLFLVVSAVLLILLRPILRRYMPITRTNVDAVVGTRGYVTAAVDNDAGTGTVKLGALPWSARSTSGRPIPVDTLVRVDRVEGVKAFVSPVASDGSGAPEVCL